MQKKDIYLFETLGNSFLPIYTGFTEDSGGNVEESVESLNLTEILKWVELNSQNWYGGINLKWVPLKVSERKLEDPKDLSMRFNGKQKRWYDLWNRPIDFSGPYPVSVKESNHV